MTSNTTTTTTTSDTVLQTTLSIVVIGASGDLAKKKTYPSLFALYYDQLIPTSNTQLHIYGYARSPLIHEELRQRLRPYLLTEMKKFKSSKGEDVIDNFLSCCYYQSGTSYGDITAYTEMIQSIKAFEVSSSSSSKEDDIQQHQQCNRLFYFAIPPSAFAETAIAIKQTSMQDTTIGWTRLIVEKPFGRDLQSFEELNTTLSQHFTEDHIYRIDHYLGKELVQNLTVMRFANIWLEKIWNNQCIESIILTFKEPFGTDGRGGYFDSYGIIRDILQNHLLQVLSLLCMETPIAIIGEKSSKAIRDAKVAVLNAISPITRDDIVLGQYKGYADDPTITNKETTTPTFAVIKLKINTPRWHNVPIILKAGKALNERKAEIRIQFKDAPAAEYLFDGMNCPRNELVMRMQPNEAVYLKTNVKSPGFHAIPIQSELEVNYDTRYFDRATNDDSNNNDGTGSNPEAYTRLILDVIHGKHASFVRDDELRRAWEIFTPILHEIESNNNHTIPSPIIYEPGGRGPKEADEFIEKYAHYIRNVDYKF